MRRGQRGKGRDVDGLREAHDPEVAGVHAQDRRRARGERRRVVGHAGAVGRAHLDQLCAALLHDGGDAEAATDLDGLSPRDDDLAPPAQRGQGQHQTRGVVIDGKAILGAGHVPEQGAEVLIARATGAP